MGLLIRLLCCWLILALATHVGVVEASLAGVENAPDLVVVASGGSDKGTVGGSIRSGNWDNRLTNGPGVSSIVYDAEGNRIKKVAGSSSLGDTTGNSGANAVRRTPDTALLNGYEVVGWSENSATPLVREAVWWLIKPDGSGLVDKYNFGYGYSDTTGLFKVRLRLIDRLHRDSNPLGIGGWVFTDALAINKSGAILATGSRYGQSGRYALIIPRGGGAGEL